MAFSSNIVINILYLGSILTSRNLNRHVKSCLILNPKLYKPMPNRALAGSDWARAGPWNNLVFVCLQLPVQRVQQFYHDQ